MTPRRLLITSVGSLVGQNILDGLAHQRGAYFVIGLNSEADAVSNFLCDRVYLTEPLQQGEAFQQAFDAIVAHEAPDLILPGRDDDVVFLAQWAAQQATGGPQVMVGSPDMATMLRDKWLTCRFAQSHGLPFVHTLCAQDGFAAVQALADRYGWPLVAKPRTGNASRGVVLVGDADELAVAFAWPGYCFQPWLGARPDLRSLRQSLQGGVPLGWSLPGIETTDLLACIAPSADIVGSFCTLHSEQCLGRTERVQVLDSRVADSVLRAYGQVLSAKGWRGPFNVQLGVSADGELLAFELNGRFTGSSATLGYLGLDFIPVAIAAFIGPVEAAPEPLLTARSVSKRLRDWPMPDQAMATLRRTRVWSRAGE